MTQLSIYTLLCTTSQSENVNLLSQCKELLFGHPVLEGQCLWKWEDGGGLIYAPRGYADARIVHLPQWWHAREDRHQRNTSLFFSLFPAYDVLLAIALFVSHDSSQFVIAGGPLLQGRIAETLTLGLHVLCTQERDVFPTSARFGKLVSLSQRKKIYICSP